MTTRDAYLKLSGALEYHAPLADSARAWLRSWVDARRGTIEADGGDAHVHRLAAAIAAAQWLPQIAAARSGILDVNALKAAELVLESGTPLCTGDCVDCGA